MSSIVPWVPSWLLHCSSIGGIIGDHPSADRARWLGQFGTGRPDYWTIEAGRDAAGPTPQPRTVAAYRCGEITSGPAAWVRCTCQPDGANPP